MRCPNCGETVTGREFRPFCSSRCRRLDLGRWLDGSYRIPGPPAEPTLEPPGVPRDDEEKRWDA